MKIRQASGWVALVVAVGVALAGCGQKAGTMVDDGTDTTSTSTSSDSTFNSSLFTSTTGTTTTTSNATSSATSSTTVTTPTTTPTTAPTVAPTAAPTATPAPTETPVALPDGYQLQVDVLDPHTSGILLWKKMNATIRIINPSFLFSQSGTLTITFSKDGQEVETTTQTLTLTPAEIRDIPVKSQENADTVTATIQ